MERPGMSGPLLAAALGVGALMAGVSALAQGRPVRSRDEAPRTEVIVTATRLTDEVLTAKVVQALRDDPYVFSDHMSVVTENGVVRLQGIALDVGDLLRALTLARRVAGKRRVVNEMEILVADFGS
jgi:osmotically-inducible protein OsmY